MEKHNVALFYGEKKGLADDNQISQFLAVWLGMR